MRTRQSEGEEKVSSDKTERLIDVTMEAFTVKDLTLEAFTVKDQCWISVFTCGCQVVACSSCQHR